jgi:outer membrane protein assembly factor BamB
MGPKRDAVWSETGIVDSLPKDGPKVVWRAKVSGGYAGPAVANGKVYLMDYLTDADNKGEIYERPKIAGKERVLCLSADKGEKIWEHVYDCNYAISFPNGPRVTPM